MVDLPRVTDHAMLRYLERAKGFDIEAVRLHIATTCAASCAAGAWSLKVEGVRFEFQSGKVITVTPGGGGTNRTKRERLAERFAK